MRVKQHFLEVTLLAALALAACSPAPTAAPTAAPATAPATEVPPTQAAAGPLPAVVVSAQDAAQGSVTIDEVTAAEPGWIVIHISKDGGPGPVIGYSAVQPGLKRS